METHTVPGCHEHPVTGAGQHGLLGELGHDQGRETSAAVRGVGGDLVGNGNVLVDSDLARSGGGACVLDTDVDRAGGTSLISTSRGRCWRRGGAANDALNKYSGSRVHHAAVSSGRMAERARVGHRARSVADDGEQQVVGVVG